MIVAVIGGGASGMAAALWAAGCGAKVTLLERQARVGRKLAATGNGRCNLTNLGASPERYPGGGGFASPSLERFGPEETLNWFAGLGLVTVAEPGGRVYPLSDQAGSVVDVLRFALASAGVETRFGTEVTGVRREKDGFRLGWEGGGMNADRVIVACGGAAGAKLGGGPWGYRLLERLGHGVTPLRPSLVQLRVAEPVVRGLKGVRADGRACVLRGGELLAESAGEIQFTDYGLSGPAVFEVSRAAEAGTTVSLNLLRDYDRDAVSAMLRARRDACPDLTLADVFTGMIQNRLGRVLVRCAGRRETETLRTVSDGVLCRLAETAGDLRFTVTGDQGFDGAQVTAGGVRTEEFDPLTMESLLVPGLYACGEVLDVDGECGGFNLQWAWSSGRAAGLAAGRGRC